MEIKDLEISLATFNYLIVSGLLQLWIPIPIQTNVTKFVAFCPKVSNLKKLYTGISVIMEIGNR